MNVQRAAGVHIQRIVGRQLAADMHRAAGVDRDRATLDRFTVELAVRLTSNIDGRGDQMGDQLVLYIRDGQPVGDFMRHRREHGLDGIFITRHVVVRVGRLRRHGVLQLHPLIVDIGRRGDPMIVVVFQILVAIPVDSEGTDDVVEIATDPWRVAVYVAGSAIVVMLVEPHVVGITRDGVRTVLIVFARRIATRYIQRVCRVMGR